MGIFKVNCNLFYLKRKYNLHFSILLVFNALCYVLKNKCNYFKNNYIKGLTNSNKHCIFVGSKGNDNNKIINQ